MRTLALLGLFAVRAAVTSAQSHPPQFIVDSAPYELDRQGSNAPLGISSDGMKVFWQRELGGWHAIDMFDLEGKSAYNDSLRRTLLNHSIPIRDISIDSAGERLVFRGGPVAANAFGVLNVASGTFATVQAADGFQVSHLQLARGGGFVLYETAQGPWRRLIRHDLTTGDTRVVAAIDPLQYYFTFPYGELPERMISDDGSLVTYVHRLSLGDEEPGTCKVVSLPQGAPNIEWTVNAGGLGVIGAALSGNGGRLAYVTRGSAGSPGGPQRTVWTQAVNALTGPDGVAVQVGNSTDGLAVPSLAVTADASRVFWESEGNFGGAPAAPGTVSIFTNSLPVPGSAVRITDDATGSGSLSPRPTASGTMLAVAHVSPGAVSLRLQRYDRTGAGTAATAPPTIIDPRTPFDIVSTSCNPSLPGSDCETRIGSAGGAGTPSNVLYLFGSTSGGGHDFAEWLVQDFLTGQESEATAIIDASAAAPLSFRVIGAGEQLDVHDHGQK